MISDRNTPLYDLFFASNHHLGFVKMKEAMWAVDDSGKFTFSREMRYGQASFGLGVLDPLKSLLVRSLRGKEQVLAERIYGSVEQKTQYLRKHAKAALRELEDEGRILVHPVKANGAKRRSKTYPSDVLIDGK